MIIHKYQKIASFRSLNLCEQNIEATSFIGWKIPSIIQKRTIPLSMMGRDIIGIAQTGSGKTGAFVLPVIEGILSNPQPFYALILVPTRELGIQILEQFSSLGQGINLKCTLLIGGISHFRQVLSLAKRPYLLIATPGRVIEHITNTLGFNLHTLKHLVLDEADKLLTLDFEKEIDKIFKIVPEKKKTQLFSSTMTKKLTKLQRACLHETTIIEISRRFTTPRTLSQFYMFIPLEYKDPYLLNLLMELERRETIIFAKTRESVMTIGGALRKLGIDCISIDGKLSQLNRLNIINKFKLGKKAILVATEVASRGLDIPTVDTVINYDVPSNPKDYVHRVGRTARKGREGRSITFVTTQDIESFRTIERLIGKNMKKLCPKKEKVLKQLERIRIARKAASLIIKSRVQRISIVND